MLKSSLTTLFLFFIAFFSFAQVNLNNSLETWSQKTSLLLDIPTRQDAGMIAYNNKLYIIAGNCTNQSSSLRDFWEYDPQTKSFSKLPDLPTQSINALGAVANNRLYYYNGGIWVEYNFATKTFVNKASFPGGSMHACFVINDTIFAAGSSNLFYAYNVVTNSWSARANHPGAARVRSNYFSIGGKGYLGGGDNGGTLYVDFYEYDPILNTWAAKTNIPQAKFLGISAATATKGYVGTGQLTQGSLPNANWFEYDPLLNSWTAKATGLDAVVRSTCATIGNELFVFSGSKRGTNVLFNTSFISRLNTTTNTWTKDTAYAGGNRVSSNSIFYNGKIYFTGGDDMEARKEVRAYDIATDSWSRLGDMPGTGFSQKAQAVINDKLYTVGGSNNTFQSTSGTNELLEYTPATDSWATKANYPNGIHSEMAAFSINGYMYAGLGVNGTGAANTTLFSRFDPVSNTWSGMAACPVSGRVSASFAIADTGYVIFEGGGMYAYAPITNTWQVKANLPVAAGAGAPTSTTRGFSINNKGYFIRVFAFASYYTEMLEYDPVLNTWAFKTSWPVQYSAPTTAVVVNAVYLGLGFKRYNTSNQLWKLNFLPDISDSIGDATKPLEFLPAQAQTFFDSLGNIMGVIQSKLSATINLRTRRIDPAVALREKFGWFGNAKKENGMFLNRNITITGNIDSATSRLYFFNDEVDSLVSKFNRKHQTSFTVADVKVLHFLNQTDLDPLNNFTENTMNNTFVPRLLNTTTGSYKNGRWFEFKSQGAGEFYVLLNYLKPSPTTITWTGGANDSLFFSGNNWLPIKLPEFTDTIIIPAGMEANFIYNPLYANNFIIGDSVGTYGSSNVREVIVDGQLNLLGNSFSTNTYGITGKFLVNNGGIFKTNSQVYASNKNNLLPASLSIINSGTIEAPFLSSNNGWLKMQDGIYKNGILQNNGKLEITNSLLQNVTEFTLLAGANTDFDSLKLYNTNTHFVFNATPVTLTYPLNVNLQSNNGNLLLQLPGKPTISGSVDINNPTLSAGLTINASDTITLTGNTNYSNKGDLQINRPLVLTGNLVHNGIGNGAVNLNANVTVNGVFQFSAFNLGQPLIIEGGGNNIFKWPSALKVPSLTVNKSVLNDTISFYNPIAIDAGAFLKKGTLTIKPVALVPNTLVILGGVFTTAADAKLVIEQ